MKQLPQVGLKPTPGDQFGSARAGACTLSSNKGKIWLKLSSPFRDLLLLTIPLGDPHPENILNNFRASSQILSGWLRAMLFNTATTQHRGKGRRNTAWCRGLHGPDWALDEPGFVVWFTDCWGFINQQETPSSANLEKLICYELSLARNDPGWRDHHG